MSIKEFFTPIKIKHENPLEYTFRWLSAPCARLLAKTPVSANMVSISKIPLMIIIMALFASGDVSKMIAASLGLFLYNILDCIDGDLATLKNQCSIKGEWLEDISDRIFCTVGGFLGLSLTIGITKQMGGIAPWVVFSFIAIGWHLFKSTLQTPTPGDDQTSLREEFLDKKESSSFGKIAYFLYYWVELLTIPAAILFIPLHALLHINTFFVLMFLYALLYNAFWILIVYKQYLRFKHF